MTTVDSSLVGEGRVLALVPAPPPPWYMTPPAIADRRELEDEHTRILAQAVGGSSADRARTQGRGGRRAAAALRVTDVALQERAGDGGELELVDAFAERTLVI
ncbi:MAG: hypothetical protein LC777_16735, partial [Actinobacteria bacterium]|nr:hypothetical protein [Actinomycetota bacterium]